VSVPEALERPTDAELIAGWRSGDEAAAAELVRRHTRAVAGFLAGAGAREDLDDLVQETFFRADDREPADERNDPHALAVERDLVGRLERAVQELPPMQRDVFLMRAQQGAEYGEIAEALETSVGAARVHYHQAVKRLKAILE
jgi:RNA polymerase sigma-70 factor (ECF subfamily)